jgi:hypothetical protein
MAVRKKGRSVVEVSGRRFFWHVHRETHVRIASEDKRFVVAYRWVGEPELSVSGPEFPGLSPFLPRPVILRPPSFAYSSPAELARQVIRWVLSPRPARLHVVTSRRSLGGPVR